MVLPKKCYGVVEIRTSPSGWWEGCLNITPLVEQVPAVTGALFDVDNIKGLKPIAARREIPEDRSFMTETLVQEMNLFYYNATWIRPAEIKQAFNVIKTEKGWATVFKLISDFAEQYGENNCRLIVWFS
jgi:hypothetical protein